MLRHVVLLVACTRVATADPTDGEVIEVTGEAPTVEPVSYRLTRDELDLIPGTGDDVLRAAQVLPGVARIPFSLGGLALRGTSPADTAVYLDGVEVPIAFHFGGVTSFYPSEMLADLTVTPGGFDAEHGRAEGGIVTLTTREPRTDRWRIGGAIDLLGSSVTAEGPVAGGGVIVGVRRSYLDAIVGPFVSAETPLPSYWDAQVRGSFGDPAKHGRITPMLFLSFDHLADHEPGTPGGAKHQAISSLFVRAAVPYQRRWGALSLDVVPWLGTNDLSYLEVASGIRTTYSRPVYPAGLRATLARNFTWGQLRGGIDTEGGYLSHSQFDLPMYAPPQNGTSTVGWLDGAAWAAARSELLGDRLAVEPSVRIDRYGVSSETVIDPRLDVDFHATSTVTVRGAVGRYHQPPRPWDIDPIGGNPALHSSYYDQASLGIDAVLPAAIAASLTGFVASGHDLAQEVYGSPIDIGALGPTIDLLVASQLGLPIARNNSGSGRSKGIELAVKRHVGRWFGLLAYTLSKTEITYPFFPADWHRFDLDQRHHLEVAGSVELAPWTLGARVELVTGDPYTPLNEPAYSGTLPTFFQLDARADRVWHRCWGDIHAYADIENATDQRNIEARVCDGPCGIGAGPEREVPGLPILPFIGVKLVPR